MQRLVYIQDGNKTGTKNKDPLQKVTRGERYESKILIVFGPDLYYDNGSCTGYMIST